MGDQASMNGGRRYNGNGSPGVLDSLSEFGNDVATLAELQAKLAALDFKESAERALVPIVVVGAGLALLLAALPVALLGVAALIASALSIHEGWAMLLTAGVTLAIAGGLVAVAGARLGHSVESFRRSREELTRNLAWIRTVLVHSGRSAPRRPL